MVAIKKREVLPGFQIETLPKEKPALPFVLKLGRLGFSTLGRIFPKAAGKLAYHLFTRPRLRAVHKSSDELLESARIFEVLYGKQILKAYEWGSGERTVLLVHGWESRGTALRSFVPGLVAEGYRVVAFDGPAHGNSDGKWTNLVHFAGAIRAVMNQAGEVHGIISHSFGGACSVFLLSQLEPEWAMKKLVLVGVPANMEFVFKNAFELMQLPPAAEQAFRSIISQKLGNLPFHIADLEYGLGKAKIEDVLVVHDKFDESVPFESAERIFERGENVSMLVTQGLGHFKLMKNPKVVERVVDFVVEA